MPLSLASRQVEKASPKKKPQASLGFFFGEAFSPRLRVLKGIRVIPEGFEPATHRLEICCSIQLSYGTMDIENATKKEGAWNGCLEVIVLLVKHTTSNSLISCFCRGGRI
jgi:hypothetical protein